MSVHQTLVAALPVLGMGEEPGQMRANAQDLPGRVPPPTPWVVVKPPIEVPSTAELASRPQRMSRVGPPSLMATPLASGRSASAEPVP